MLRGASFQREFAFKYINCDFLKLKSCELKTLTAFLLLILFALIPNGLRAKVDLPDLGPQPVFPERDHAAVKLGQLLFYDPILSGNRNISCATCHHPRFGTSDGLSLSIGEGGVGLGPERRADPNNLPEQLLPRNAQALWNLGATEFSVFFHDGRLEDDADEPYGIRTPLGSEMSQGFNSALAAQAMFPVLSQDEMAGHYSENDVSRAVRLGLITQNGGAWDLIAKRVAQIDFYRTELNEIYPGQEITFAMIANVIADFIAFEWRADNSLFDRAMRDEATLSQGALEGLDLFYGKGGCARCHSGWMQTDHQFHAIALPQFGPGKAARFEAHNRDDGRLRVTGDQADAYAFRTPSLRNVTLTAPYGHNGAYADLGDMVRHHLDPVARLMDYTLANAILPDWTGEVITRELEDGEALKSIASANTLEPIDLSDDEVEKIILFLETLEDPAERLGVPQSVPSGLPVE